jgi:hypothetical protein
MDFERDDAKQFVLSSSSGLVTYIDGKKWYKMNMLLVGWWKSLCKKLCVCEFDD